MLTDPPTDRDRCLEMLIDFGTQKATLETYYLELFDQSDEETWPEQYFEFF